MSKKKLKKETSANTTPDMAADARTAAEAHGTADAETEHTLSKKERKAAKRAAARAAEKAAETAAEKAREATEREAKKHAKKLAKKANKSAKESATGEEPHAAPAMPKFKHLRKKKLTSGKGATPREVGESLVALFNAGKADEAEKTWYHRKIESIEGDGSVFEGLKGVAEKSAWWCTENKIVSAKAEGPFVCSTGFTVIFTMTIDRPDGSRMEFREAGVYTVEKGRIVREQFMF